MKRIRLPLRTPLKPLSMNKWRNAINRKGAKGARSGAGIKLSRLFEFHLPAKGRSFAVAK